MRPGQVRHGAPVPQCAVKGRPRWSSHAWILPGRPTATAVLHLYRNQHVVELAHRATRTSSTSGRSSYTMTTASPPLVSVVGLALVIYGLIETDLRQAVGPDQHLPGLLPKGRAARSTGRNILAAFQGLGATYTPHGLRLDRLANTQRTILNHLNIALPWPEQGH
jgi:hypothetical protein